MDFLETIGELLEHMLDSDGSWEIEGILCRPDLDDYQRQETSLVTLPIEYMNQLGDDDHGFHGDALYPLTYPDGDGGVMYLHVTFG